MTTARNFGSYDLAAALADLIDNSIKANASLIDISFHPTCDDIIVKIRDDGKGMARNELINAMRPASANPEDERDKTDLGRFGWGLKSASLSQARVLTVVTWQDRDKVSAARWDIDDIDEWEMDFFEAEDALDLLEGGLIGEGGTEVIWSSSDRLVDEADDTTDENLTHKIAHANEKLALIFHRYLSGDAPKKLNILVNGQKLYPRDPFLVSHPATQTLDPDEIHMTNGSLIKVQPYILPHFSKLTSSEQRSLGGPEGMVRNQGFYVYRNFRLIIHGTWFRIVPHGELSQLTRVKVDIPNSADSAWRITVDKSDAQLPSVLKKRLRSIVKKFNIKASSVHRNKGVNLDLDSRKSVWVRNVKNGQIRYQINREHPLVSTLLSENSQSGSVDAVLKLLESYFPIDRFMEDGNSDKREVNQSITSIEEFGQLVDQAMLNYLKSIETQPDVEQFLSFIKDVEPFSSQWRYTESHVRENIGKWGITI